MLSFIHITSITVWPRSVYQFKLSNDKQLGYFCATLSQQ